MENQTFIETYFFYCNERCTIEGLISELEKSNYFPIEIEDIYNIINYPVDRVAFSIIALTETIDEDKLRIACKIAFEEGKIKSPFILMVDPCLEKKMSIYFDKDDPNLFFHPFSINKLKEVIERRKRELLPFQCNLHIPDFELSIYDVQIGKYTDEGTIIYEDKTINKFFNAFIENKSISQSSFSDLIKSIYHRKQHLTNRIRINSKTYLLYILPIPSNKAINFSLMNY